MTQATSSRGEKNTRSNISSALPSSTSWARPVVAAVRPRGTARHHSHLSEHSLGRNHRLRRPCRQAHGRRSARLLRLAARPRGRCGSSAEPAEPNTVVAADSTRRLVAGLFDMVDLGHRKLKGFSISVSAWRIASETDAEGRFDAQHGVATPPRTDCSLLRRLRSLVEPT
jgi:hypothetical protein